MKLIKFEDIKSLSSLNNFKIAVFHKIKWFDKNKYTYYLDPVIKIKCDEIIDFIGDVIRQLQMHPIQTISKFMSVEEITLFNKEIEYLYELLKQKLVVLEESIKKIKESSNSDLLTPQNISLIKYGIKKVRYHATNIKNKSHYYKSLSTEEKINYSNYRAEKAKRRRHLLKALINDSKQEPKNAYIMFEKVKCK